MPTFHAHLLLSRPVGEVFDFFTSPTNLLLVAPPEANLQIVSGPDRLELGSTFTCKSKHLGVSQQIVVEVVDFQPGKGLTIHQRRGPLKQWAHTTLFAEHPEGTDLRDRIDFEPPGGLLGLLVTAQFIEDNLQAAFAHRATKLREVFA